LKLRKALLGFAIVLGLPGSGSASPAPGPPPVRDAQDRVVHLQERAERIVALAPHISENLFALGAGSQLVGVVDYSDFPPEARDLPRVGGVGGINLERVISLRPDLVIAWGSGTEPRVLSALERFGIPTYVDEIRSLADLERSLENLGTLSGHEATAGALARSVRRAGRGAPGAPGGGPPRVFLQIWDTPLQSIGGDHLLTEVIERCGGQSVTAGAAGLAPRVSLEAIVTADPHLILVESLEQARIWDRFPDLQAHRGTGIRVIDPDQLYRPTLRLLKGIETVCEAITALTRDPPRPRAAPGRPG